MFTFLIITILTCIFSFAFAADLTTEVLFTDKAGQFIANCTVPIRSLHAFDAFSNAGEYQGVYPIILDNPIEAVCMQYLFNLGAQSDIEPDCYKDHTCVLPYIKLLWKYEGQGKLLLPLIIAIGSKLFYALDTYISLCKEESLEPLKQLQLQQEIPEGLEYSAIISAFAETIPYCIRHTTLIDFIKNSCNQRFYSKQYTNQEFKNLECAVEKKLAAEKKPFKLSVLPELKIWEESP